VTHGTGSWDSSHYQQSASGGPDTSWSPPPPSDYGSVDPVSLGWVSVRIESVLRMQRVSYNHALTATTDRPQGRLPGPHAFALLFATTSQQWTPERPSFVLTTASRMFPWTDDRRRNYNVRDADALLETMTKIAVTAHNAGAWDPLTITDRTDTLPPGADFVGVGLSSIGEPRVDWGRVKPTAFGLDLPSHCDIYLRDGSWIEIARDGRTTWTMKSNNFLGYLTGFEASNRHIPREYEPRPGSIHYWLQQFTTALDQAYHASAERARRQH
jgi:hypothetical protein